MVFDELLDSLQLFRADLIGLQQVVDELGGLTLADASHHLTDHCLPRLILRDLRAKVEDAIFAAVRDKAILLQS